MKGIHPLALLVFCVAALGSTITSAEGQDAQGTAQTWKVGLAQVKITPEKPILMAGYSARTKPYESIASDIFAKAMVLEDQAGNRAALVTSDLSGFRPEVVEPVCAAIGEKTGLARKQILLNASHNHSGPMLSLDPQARGKLLAEDMRNSVEYTRRLQEKLIGLVVEAAARLEPARLSWGIGVAPFVMNRREFTPTGVILGVNPRGPADRSVPVLRVENSNGTLRAVVFGAACHNTTLTASNYRIAGDYAGYAQAYVQERYPSVQAMFMIGCGGDANPYPRSTLELAREHGATLGQEVCRVLETKLQPVRGPLRVELEKVDLPFQPPPSRQELQGMLKGPSWQTTAAQAMIDTLDRGEALPRSQTCPVAVWQFGADLTLVGLAGEVVVDFVSQLEKALGPLQLWISAYCNDVFGYLPSARLLGESGYETKGITGKGFFAPQAQDVLVQKVRELAARAGRSLKTP